MSGTVVSGCCGTIRWADRPAVGNIYTAALGNWAPASRPVRAVGGVYTGAEGRRGAGRKVRRMGTADLLSRARAGDGEAFRELAESHRRELQVHCYRMLGSLQDAEGAVQETMLAAWQGIGGFTEERASLRTWLYKIATNRCLNARRAASRRPVREWDMSQFEAPVPTPPDEPVWLQPFSDAFLEGAADRPLGPEVRYEQTEAISLAFVTALQLLPPRQLAVLILRDVLGFHASEVASMLEVTIESVNSALKRARASLRRRPEAAAGQQPPPAAGSPAPPPAARAPPPPPRRRLARRGRDRRHVREGVGVGRSRRAGGPADRRRLHRYASGALRIRGP